MPINASLIEFSINEKSAMQELCFFSGKSCLNGTKYTFLQLNKVPIFRADAPNASFVDTAISRGFSFLTIIPNSAANLKRQLARFFSCGFVYDAQKTYDAFVNFNNEM